LSKKEQKQASSSIFKADISKLKEYIDSKQSLFEKRIEEQRQKDRQTMEKGMVYWINT